MNNEIQNRFLAKFQFFTFFIALSLAFFSIYLAIVSSELEKESITVIFAFVGSLSTALLIAVKMMISLLSEDDKIKKDFDLQNQINKIRIKMNYLYLWLFLFLSSIFWLNKPKFRIFMALMYFIILIFLNLFRINLKNLNKHESKANLKMCFKNMIEKITQPDSTTKDSLMFEAEHFRSILSFFGPFAIGLAALELSFLNFESFKPYQATITICFSVIILCLGLGASALLYRLENIRFNLKNLEKNKK